MTEQSSTPSILIFDSGVGGLSVLAKIRDKLPSARLIYAADNAAFPYGTKEEADVIARVSAVVPAIVREHRPDLVVIACNTASTVALEPLRDMLPMPVVGVVPAIKPAAELSRSRVIGLLGTPGTVRRRYTQDLIDRFAADCIVVRHGSAELVEIAERKLHGIPVDQKEIQAIVDALRDHERGHDIDVVIMACTHFPLVADELKQCAPRRIAWIDSGDAIARRVMHLLDGRGAKPADGSPLGHLAIFTAPDEMIENLRGSLESLGIKQIEVMKLPAVPTTKTTERDSQIRAISSI